MFSARSRFCEVPRERWTPGLYPWGGEEKCDLNILHVALTSLLSHFSGSSQVPPHLIPQSCQPPFHSLQSYLAPLWPCCSIKRHCVFPPPFPNSLSLPSHTAMKPHLNSSSGSMPGPCGTTGPSMCSWSFVLRTARMSTCSSKTTALCSGNPPPPSHLPLPGNLCFLCCPLLSAFLISLAVLSPQLQES